MRSRYLTLQRQLTRSVREEMVRLLGEEPPDIKRYYQAYKRTFKDYEQIVTLPQLVNDLKNESLILVGDFHSCYTSQKGFIRLVQRMLEKSADRKYGIILECLRDDQSQIFNNYRSGKIDYRTFLKEVDWDNTWGFPSDHYQKLFTFSFSQDLPVCALRPHSLENIPLKDQDPLFAASIRKHMNAFPEVNTWFVLVGDLHLAQEHLPKAVKSDKKISPKTTIVYQNSEQIYWKLAKFGLEQNVDCVRIEKGSYCLNAVAPWIKYQTYVQWLKTRIEEKDDDELDEDLLFSQVDNDHIQEILEYLIRFLGLPNPDTLDHFETYAAHELSFLERIKLNRHFSQEEMAKIELWLGERDAFFIPRENILYFPFPKPTQLATQASIFLFALLTQFEDIFFSVSRDFYRFIILEAIGYLGAKILNPKLKCNLPHDFVRMLKSSDAHILSKREHMPLGRERQKMLRFVLDHLDHCHTYLSGGAFNETFPDLSIHNERPYYWISIQLGRYLGDRIHEAYVNQKVTIEQLRSLWTTPLDSSDEALNMYLEWLEAVDAPIDFKRSKRARI